ncbi:hypothetical protein E6P09_12335 [Haloferax mediterranei ATCC 33500]|uniref:DUF7988 domain-containing protein n=1 Tax=Haloferax mediterranei (strain ATCC 33500 / DSM 1411 / JCM 8866 / NBRC 14739 / NCIMB 2177 / R-4) TaxID=523841 RepID=I3R8K0_HALMT|nr:hypothetical protein [Haloferax mediterranei]AFK20560.1 hypothetical protein HFX_2890 [Haloferax mediterranei ATCC 33500]AHZ23917.1 hypothetical protein BM92_15245 [Haloferax mediterranei ATCC 33500]ELZ98342.1 hypothetical protein C439_16195 [Haloferax mediterranei ATCC 33500]MDX5986685.1 hypothetical protein [Haloferax mediterranei ATCC 33500]QCQ76012.1 hypothetical protein E6P09_12335 [Haloferax mediterranei ATCC 33500]
MTDGTSRAAAIDEAERVLQEEHDRLLTVVRQCADAVAAKWDGDSVSDRDRVVPPFGRALDGSGALSRLPRALANAVTATGRPMAAPPVAGPPYVVVTGEGVVLRATVGDERLVILLRTFEVDDGGDGDEGDDEISEENTSESNRYRRIDGLSLEIEIR